VVVLFAGSIRPERRLDLLIESARHWPTGRKLAVVGTDWGAWARCARLANDYNLDIAARVEFVELEELTAAVSAADLLVVPSDRAGQSGVLALARQLGTRAVTANSGGMAELASRTFSPGDVEDLMNAIQGELVDPSATDSSSEEQTAVESHLRAYGESA
jgi:glycosyltransferase involved in cell wall biosynthesis